MPVEATDGTRDGPTQVARSRPGDAGEPDSDRGLRGVALRSAIAWALGVSGTVAAIAGLGPVAFAPDTRVPGVLRVAVPAALFVLVAAVSWSRRRPGFADAASLLVVGLTVALTSGNVGRAPGLVASLGVVIAWNALVGPFRSSTGSAEHRGSSPEGASSLVVAVALVGLAQVVWLVDVGTPAVLALLGVAGAEVLLGRFAPSTAERIEAPVRSARAAVVAVLDLDEPPMRWFHSLRRRVVESPRWTWAAVAAAGATAAVLAPLFARFAREPTSVLGFSDYVTHLDISGRVDFFRPTDVIVPHPVFHYSVAALDGLGQVTATALVMAAAVAATVLVLVWFARRSFAGRPPLGPALAIAYGVGYFVVESPAVLANLVSVGNPYDWAPTNHMYLSPTDTLLVPFAVVMVALLGRAMLEGSRLGRQEGTTVAIATVAATVAKPSMTLALLVAVPAVALLHRHVRRELVGFLAIWFVVPAALVIIAQTLVLELGTAEVSEAGIEIRPMETIRSVGLDQIGPLLFAPTLVIVICLFAGWRRYLGEPTVRLSLWSMAAAVVILFLFNETGERSQDGTFTKPAFIAWIVLHIVSWRFLLGEYRFGSVGRRRPWVLGASALVVVGAAAGVVAYFDAVGWMSLPQRGGG